MGLPSSFYLVYLVIQTSHQRKTKVDSLNAICEVTHLNECMSMVTSAKIIELFYRMQVGGSMGRLICRKVDTQVDGKKVRQVGR